MPQTETDTVGAGLGPWHVEGVGMPAECGSEVSNRCRRYLAMIWAWKPLVPMVCENP
jgi:hypothetical protein